MLPRVTRALSYPIHMSLLFKKISDFAPNPFLFLEKTLVNLSDGMLHSVPRTDSISAAAAVEVSLPWSALGDSSIQ